jgi:hypothetical protein
MGSAGDGIDGAEGVMDGEAVEQVDEAAVTEGAAAPPPGEDAAAALALAREALIAAHPDAVPELIAGATPAELRASLAVAKAAYARALEVARAHLAGQAVSPGAPGRTLPVNAAALSPSAKIAAAIRSRQP